MGCPIIHNSLDEFNSLDAIARIQELESIPVANLTDEAIDELNDLRNLAKECENYPEWHKGVTLYHEEAFPEHIQKIILAKYPDLPNIIKWHIDWDQMVEDEFADEYAEVDFCGEKYRMKYEN